MDYGKWPFWFEKKQPKCIDIGLKSGNVDYFNPPPNHLATIPLAAEGQYLNTKGAFD